MAWIGFLIGTIMAFPAGYMIGAVIGSEKIKRQIQEGGIDE